MPDITCLADLRAARERRETEETVVATPAEKALIPLKIESDFPMPVNTDDSFIYLWDQMKVGQCFFVPGRTMQSVTRRVQKRQKASGHRYLCRAMNGGVRVWRKA